MASLRSRKSRKCARWFVPNCVSKPSSVRPRGVAMTPALVIRILTFPPLFSKMVLAPSRTDFNDTKSMITGTMGALLAGSPPSISLITSWSLDALRAVAKTVAPVACRARAASTPMPLEQPVMTADLPTSLPTRSSSLMI
jgi:hypothetical protein